MNETIKAKHTDLSKHPLYVEINSLDRLRTFMKWHVFAVWDFMSLLKALQNKITCTTVPWTDSEYSPKLVRLINEIVLGEESDLDADGNPGSHFKMYLEAMDEVGAPTQQIKTFLKNFNFDDLPMELRDILSFHLGLAMNGKPHEVAASFFYGREKLIPDMFEAIVQILETEGLSCPKLVYYLKRHIELDGEEHGPMAEQCLNDLLDNEVKREEAQNIALKSLDMRNKLWNFIFSEFSTRSDDLTL